MIGASDNEEEEGREPAGPGEFEYEVVDPDAWSRGAGPDIEPDHAIADGKRQLEAIENDLASRNGQIARWGALLMLVALLLMLVLPRMGCKLRERYDRQLSPPLMLRTSPKTGNLAS